MGKRGLANLQVQQNVPFPHISFGQGFLQLSLQKYSYVAHFLQEVTVKVEISFDFHDFPTECVIVLDSWHAQVQTAVMFQRGLSS